MAANDNKMIADAKERQESILTELLTNVYQRPDPKMQKLKNNINDPALLADIKTTAKNLLPIEHKNADAAAKDASENESDPNAKEKLYNSSYLSSIMPILLGYNLDDLCIEVRKQRLSFDNLLTPYNIMLDEYGDKGEKEIRSVIYALGDKVAKLRNESRDFDVRRGIYEGYMGFVSQQQSEMVRMFLEILKIMIMLQKNDIDKKVEYLNTLKEELHTIWKNYDAKYSNNNGSDSKAKPGVECGAEQPKEDGGSVRDVDSVASSEMAVPAIKINAH